MALTTLANRPVEPQSPSTERISKSLYVAQTSRPLARLTVSQRSSYFNRLIIRFLPVAKKFTDRLRYNIPLADSKYHQSYLPNFPHWLVERQIRSEALRLLRLSKRWFEVIQNNEIKCAHDIAIGIVWFRDALLGIVRRWGWDTIGDADGPESICDGPLKKETEPLQSQSIKTLQRDELAALDRSLIYIEEYLFNKYDIFNCNLFNKYDIFNCNRIKIALVSRMLVQSSNLLPLSETVSYQQVGQKSPNKLSEEDDKLTEFEKTLLKAHHELGGGLQKGAAIAKRAGYNADARLYTALSGLVKRRYLESSHKGYSPGPRVLTDISQ